MGRKWGKIRIQGIFLVRFHDKVTHQVQRAQKSYIFSHLLKYTLKFLAKVGCQEQLKTSFMWISCFTTYQDMKRTVMTTIMIKQSTKIVTMMTAVVEFGMIAFFRYVPLSLVAYASVPMIPKNTIKNIPQTIAKFLIDDLQVTQFFLSCSQSKVRVWVSRYLNSVQHSSHLAFSFGVVSILRLIHSMRHLEWVYLTDPVHLHGVTILPYFSPYRQIRHYFGPAVSCFLSWSIRCFYMELIGVNVLPSSMNFTGMLHK